MPSDYRTDVDRRIQDFAHFLKRMHYRAFEEVNGPCFIIFEEYRPCVPKLPEEEQAALTLAQEASNNDTGESMVGGLPQQGWRPDAMQNRFVQFSIEENWFCLDLPRQTLYHHEAGRILHDHRGFFYLRERADFTLYGEDVRRYDPFRKVYVYGDEESAAEDMGHVLFQIWGLPVNSRFLVTATSFNGKFHWEQGLAIQ